MALAPGTRLGAYEISDPIGAGGMGEVYRAKDTVLGRDVAVKILAPRFACDAQWLQRFEHEARLLALLNHPNIGAIYHFERGETLQALVLELVEGQTLADRLRTGSIGAREAVTIARQIVDALCAAHDKGIVHRDLKPDNIKITPDRIVKVLDFGLAKAIGQADISSEAQHDGGVRAESAITSLLELSSVAGWVIGTPGYMAPEQVRGCSVDHRTDIFAFGTILHEMLTGQQVFKGDTPTVATRAVLTEIPSDLAFRAGVPVGLARIVSRCLAKNPNDRFQSARDLQIVLETVFDAGTLAPALSAPGASIAVLPFTNMTADSENDYFSDGLAEELINALARLPGLQVAARTSTFRFRRRDLDIRDIGHQLNVTTMLDGTLRRAGKHLRITVQLIKVADGYQLWSERYDRELDDVLAIQDEITTSIVRTLAPTLLGHHVPLASRHSLNVRAFEMYLRGQQLWHQRTPQSLRGAVTSFEEAIRLDADYALAHAGLAASTAIMAAYGFAPLGEAKAAAEPAAARALALDPQLPESHFAMALYTFVFTAQWYDAESHFRRALEIDPRAAITHVHFGFFLTTRHRFDEGVLHIVEATKLDPLSPFAHALGSLSLYIARRYEDAIRLGERALALHPDLTLASWSMALALGRLGQHDRAIELLERTVLLSARAPVFVGLLGLGHAVAGHRAEATALLCELRSRSAREFVVPLAPLMIEIGLGSLDDIADGLETYLGQGYNGTSIEDILGPHIDGLARQPQIADLFARLGLVCNRTSMS